MPTNAMKNVGCLFFNTKENHGLTLEENETGIMIMSPLLNQVFLYQEDGFTAENWLWKYSDFYDRYPDIILIGKSTIDLFASQFPKHDMKPLNFWIWPEDRIPSSSEKLEYRKAITEDKEWLSNTLNRDHDYLTDQELKYCILSGKILLAFHEEEVIAVGFQRPDGTIGSVVPVHTDCSTPHELEVENEIIELALEQKLTPCALTSQENERMNNLHRKAGMICSQIPAAQAYILKN